MFERYVTSTHPRRRRWLGAVVATSFATHVVVIVCFVFAAMWHIEKLAVGKTPTVWVARSGPPPSGSFGAAPRVEPKKVTTKKLRKRPVHGLRQPTDAVTDDDPSDSAGDDGAIGVPNGIPGGTGTDPLGVGIGEPVPIGEQIAVDDLCASCPTCCEPEPPKEALIVPAKMIEGSLIEGDKQIAPPEEVKLQMANQGLDQVIASVRMCLDARGRVSSLDQIKSSGFAGYDSKLTREMSDWRYRPYEVNGRAVPVCTVITFIYRMHR